MSQFSWYYILAAKGIQKYILQGDKLSLMIGGSELVENLPGRFLSDVLCELKQCEGSDYIVLSRTAGCARLLFREKTPPFQLAEIMPLLVSLYCPGVDIVQSVCEITDGLPKTMENAERQMKIRRNYPNPVYPIPGPLVERTPRTGLPKVGFLNRSEGEPADDAMLKKDKAASEARNTLKEKIFGSDQSPIRLALDFNELAPEETDYIAIVHADANGLGKTVMRFIEDRKDAPNEKIIGDYKKFSLAIEDATKLVARNAFNRIPPIKKEGNDPYFLFRPLICAGDDFTAVLQAKDAFSFAEYFLANYPRQISQNMKSAGLDSLENVFISACIGISFIKPAFPFAQAYELCESLCKYAKEETKRRYSALAFWRVTSHMLSDFNTIRDRELASGNLCLTMMPYVIDNDRDDSFPTIYQLRQLASSINDESVPRGSFNRLLGDLQQSETLAKQGFQRVIDVARRRDKPQQEAIEQVLINLSKITNNTSMNAECLFKIIPNDAKKRNPPMLATPIHDALELLDAGTVFAEESIK